MLLGQKHIEIRIGIGDLRPHDIIYKTINPDETTTHSELCYTLTIEKKYCTFK